MKEVDKKDSEKLIRHLQENSNVFKPSDYNLFPWLNSDKNKRSRIINELASKGVFDKDCVKTGRPKLDQKGWEYFDKVDKNPSITKKILIFILKNAWQIIMAIIIAALIMYLGLN